MTEKCCPYSCLWLVRTGVQHLRVVTIFNFSTFLTPFRNIYTYIFCNVEFTQQKFSAVKNKLVFHYLSRLKYAAHHCRNSGQSDMLNHVLKHRLLLLGFKNQTHITYCCSVQLTNGPNSANTAMGFSHIIRFYTLTLPKLNWINSP